MNQKMREAFEAWYAPLFAGGFVANMPRRQNGEYVSAQAQIAWMAWQAATAAAQRDAMSVAEAVEAAISDALQRAMASDDGVAQYDLAAIVEAVLPTKPETVNHQLLARCIDQVDACMDVTQVEPEDNAAWLIVKAAAESANPASAQQQGEHEPVGFFNGEFAGDVNGRMKFSVTAYGALPMAGAKLYTAPAPACSVPEGWRMYSADFSLQAVGKNKTGSVTLIRDQNGCVEWHKLSDEEKEGVPLFVSGDGVTVEGAIVDAASRAAMLSAATKPEGGEA